MKINLILAYAFKFVTFVFFSFIILVYAGLLILLPLDILFQVIRIFAGIGFPTVVAATVGIGALGYVGYKMYLAPALYKLVVDVGYQLIEFSRAQLKRFDDLIATEQAAEG
ncbi:MAG: hypothetical protein AB1648_03620 [Pseudomonadota bacterium]|jgi:hypothetical protein